MLPPVGFALDDYKKKKNRGRPRLKRIRSRGAASSDDGERLRKRSMGLRQGRGSAQAGREALEACSLSTWAYDTSEIEYFKGWVFFRDLLAC